MSLINEALKKAQRQRLEATQSTPPLPGVDSSNPPIRVPRRDKPQDFQSQLLLVGGLALVLLCALILGGVFLWRALRSPTVKAPPPAAMVAMAPESSATPAAPSKDSLPPAARPAVPNPTAANQSPATPRLPPTEQPGAMSLSLPALISPTPSPATSTARIKPSLKMIAAIENLRVTGIRASDTESKVLMNDRVYRLNDIVDHELGIRLTGVATNSLTFTDERGAVYTRNF